MTMKIVSVPCLEDNYAYLIVDEATKEAAAVDPVEPQKLLDAAAQLGATITSVLTTHRHWDHAGGNDKMASLIPGIKVYGGSLDQVTACTHPVENGDKLSIGDRIHILCLHTPCHTKGHISYYVTADDQQDSPAVFTGDTLFIAGCGKFFEGTAEQMYQSLCVTLGSLPKPTRVYCGHEYTVKNLQFALTVEPENDKIKQKLSWAQEQPTALLMKKFLTYHDPNPVIVPKDKGFSTPPEKAIVLPSWLSENDIEYFANKFKRTGFTGGVNYYRALDMNWELTAAWTGAQIKVPAKFITGDQDLMYHFPGAKEYIHHQGGFKKDVPLLQDVVVIEGAGHFINQEMAQEVAEHIYQFISGIKTDHDHKDQDHPCMLMHGAAADLNVMASSSIMH